MTTPAASYYKRKIHQNPKLWLRYQQHRWLIFYTAKHIRSFYWKHSGDIYQYMHGKLTVTKAPVSPDWQVPNAYFRPVVISLSPKQDKLIRSALLRIPFSKCKTDPCSFVNLEHDGMIAEDFRCRFALGMTFRFAARSSAKALTPLFRVLQEVADTSPDWGKICQMEKWLFTEQRWQKLQA